MLFILWNFFFFKESSNSLTIEGKSDCDNLLQNIISEINQLFQT